MFETLKRLRGEGKLTDAALENAVRIGWIAEEQAQEIRGGLNHEKIIA